MNPQTTVENIRKIIPKKINVGHDSPVYFEDYDKPCNTDINAKESKSVFTKLQHDPQFLNGQKAWNKFIAENASFNKILTSFRPDINYTLIDSVSLKFIVRKEGGLSNIICVGGVNIAAITEAIRLLKLSCPYWVPSNFSGRNVNAWFHQSFIFSITNNGLKKSESVQLVNLLPADKKTFELEEE